MLSRVCGWLQAGGAGIGTGDLEALIRHRLRGEGARVARAPACERSSSWAGVTLSARGWPKVSTAKRFKAACRDPAPRLLIDHRQ